MFPFSSLIISYNSTFTFCTTFSEPSSYFPFPTRSSSSKFASLSSHIVPDNVFGTSSKHSTNDGAMSVSSSGLNLFSSYSTKFCVDCNLYTPSVSCTSFIPAFPGCES